MEELVGFLVVRATLKEHEVVVEEGQPFWQVNAAFKHSPVMNGDPGVVQALVCALLERVEKVTAYAAVKQVSKRSFPACLRAFNHMLFSRIAPCNVALLKTLSIGCLDNR